MLLLRAYIDKLLKRTTSDNIRIKVLGDIEKIDEGLRKDILKIVESTKNNTGLTLNIAFNYGGRDEITKAVKKIASKVASNELNMQDINEQLISDNLYTEGEPDPDLVIRTGGELRVSNFLLWQIAYAEFLFVQKYWPDFSEDDLVDAIVTFQNRNRKFGGK